MNESTSVMSHWILLYDEIITHQFEDGGFCYEQANTSVVSPCQEDDDTIEEENWSQQKLGNNKKNFHTFD